MSLSLYWKVWYSRHQEDVLRKEDYHENYIHAFNAYAPKGNLTHQNFLLLLVNINDI